MPHDNPSSQRVPASGPGRLVWVALFVVLLVVYFARPGFERWWGTGDDGGRPAAPTDAPAGSTSDEKPFAEGTDDARQAKNEKTAAGEKTSAAEKKTKFAGLKDVGGNVKVSPAGLRYTPGSEDGHRLKHVLHHAKDDPDRPGKHGVFDGGDEEALATIDEAYELAKAGGPQVRKRQEGDRTVYEVNLGRRIGYLGGEEGKRRGHPATRQVRLVLEGSKVITAFPF